MMETKSTIVDIKIAGAVSGKLVNAKVRREVERALEAYPDADQCARLILAVKGLRDSRRPEVGRRSGLGRAASSHVYRPPLLTRCGWAAEENSFSSREGKVGDGNTGRCPVYSKARDAQTHQTI
jgi:hypothetical protein